MFRDTYMSLLADGAGDELDTLRQAEETPMDKASIEMLIDALQFGATTFDSAQRPLVAAQLEQAYGDFYNFIRVRLLQHLDVVHQPVLLLLNGVRLLLGLGGTRLHLHREAHRQLSESVGRRSRGVTSTATGIRKEMNVNVW